MLVLNPFGVMFSEIIKQINTLPLRLQKKTYMNGLLTPPTPKKSASEKEKSLRKSIDFKKQKNKKNGRRKKIKKMV